jgi:hypothetical protein
MYGASDVASEATTTGNDASKQTETHFTDMMERR